MLGGSRDKKVVRMATANPVKAQSLLPMSKGMVLVRAPAPVQAGKIDPRMVMVQGTPPNLQHVLGKNAVLVPVSASADGKMIPTGGPVLSSQIQTASKTGQAAAKMAPVKTSSNGSNQPVFLPLPPGAMIRNSGPQQNKPVVLMPANQMSLGGRQQILVQVPKGPNHPGGPMVMVPVSQAGLGQGVTTSPSTSQTLKFVQQKSPQVGQNKGVSLVPISVAGSPKTGAPQPMVIRLPASQANSVGTKSSGAPMVLIPGTGNRPMKQVVTLPSGAQNTKTMLIPDPKLGNLPKGTKLIPVPSGQSPASLQFNSSHLGALQGGKLVFIPNSNAGDGLKSIILDPKSLGGPGASQLKTGQKPNYHSLIHKVGPPKGGQKIVYRQVGKTLNKPIQPKPPIETTDTFFKTPIEIKPLEEEHDDDLENVLSALTGGGGNVDLMPVNTESAVSQPEASLALDSVVPAQIDELEDMGLKIDSVYSLSSNTVSWEDETATEIEKETTGDKNKSKEKEKPLEEHEEQRSCGGADREKDKEKVSESSQNDNQEALRKETVKETDKEAEKENEENTSTDAVQDENKGKDSELEENNKETEMDTDEDRVSVDSDQTEIMDDTDLYTTSKPMETVTTENQDDTNKEVEETSKQSDDEDSDGQMEDIQVPVLSIEPLSPEDEPSQSGHDKTPEQSHDPKKGEREEEETEMDEEDPEVEGDEEGSQNQEEEDPNLMRGDCLQVRLAQQAARQLQEQMRQESESLNMVSEEWRIEEDEEMMNSSASKSPTREEDEGGDEEDNERGHEEHETGEDETVETGPEKPHSPQRDKKSTPQREGTPAFDKADSETGIRSDNETDTQADSDPKKTDGKGSESKTGENSDASKEDKVQDEAQKALVAAALNGCEVADSEELNDMFDELISEYFTTPERPKPSVRVRGIEECRADLDDGPQSLVTTTKTTPIIRTISSLASLPKPVATNKQFSVNTSAGPITLVQVKVPVPGKPGTTTIKYIPMQLPKPGQNKAQTPQFIKILPSSSASSSVGSKPISSTSKVISTQGGRPLGVTAGVGSNVVTQGKSLLKFVLAPSNASGNKLQANLATASSAVASTSSSTAASTAKPLSNEDLASAVSNAARNVLGMGNTAGGKRTGLKPSARPSLIPGRNLIPGPTIKADTSMRLLSPDNKRIIVIPPGMKLVQGPGGVPQLVMSSQAGNMPAGVAGLTSRYTSPSAMPGGLLSTSQALAPPGGFSVINPKKKKKKKKKKKQKLPKTKPCSVVLRKLNMKVVKKTVNLKRVKNSFLFEAISRRPMRGARRKAEELLSNDNKRAKLEEKESSPKTTSPASVTNTDSKTVTSPASVTLSNTSPVKTGLNTPTQVTISKDSALYKIMSQFPDIKPAPLNSSPQAKQQRAVFSLAGSQTCPMRPPRSVSLLSPGKGVSLLHKPVSLIPGPAVSTSMSNLAPSLSVPTVSKLLQPMSGLPPPQSSKAITFTLSCTTAESGSTPVLMSDAIKSIAMSSSASKVMSSTSSNLVSTPVVSPSHGTVPGGGGATNVSPSLLTGSSPLGGIATLAASTNQPSRPLPPLHPAGKVMVPNIPGNSASGVPMPALQPAPRSILGGALGVRGPIQPPTPRLMQHSLTTPRMVRHSLATPRIVHPGLPALKPRPPIVIQPNGTSAPRAGTTPTTTGSQADPNKRFLLIKTANGQFLVPVPEQGSPISLAGAKAVGSNTQVVSRGANKSLVSVAPTTAISSPSAVTVTPSPSPGPQSSTSKEAASPTPVESNRRKRHAESPVIVIKDEPADDGYDKYEHPPPPKARSPESAVRVKEEKESVEKPRKENKEKEADVHKGDNEGDKEKDNNDDGDDNDDDDDDDDLPRVPASVNHMKRIEELKARLRQHEEELAALRRERKAPGDN